MHFNVTYGDLSDGCNILLILIHLVIHMDALVWKTDIGDLGNINSDLFGNAKYVFADNVISLKISEPSCILGRMLIKFDCGMGKGQRNTESLKTGNAGKRIYCCYRVL